VLTGTEIKSIRDGKANLTDAYCTFIGTELFVRQMHISEYRFGSYLNHAAKRDRKLLLNKRELRKLQNKIKERGFTIIPVKLFVNPQGYAKLLISLAKGKKFYRWRPAPGYESCHVVHIPNPPTVGPLRGCRSWAES
jgi:SsrA-binding protein